MSLILNLPDQVIVHITIFLDPRSFLRFRSTYSIIHRICSELFDTSRPGFLVNLTKDDTFYLPKISRNVQRMKLPFRLEGFNFRSLDERCLFRCSMLETLIITTGLETVEDFFLFNCTNLKTLELPNSLRSFGDWCLYGCRELESLVLPESLTSVGDGFLTKSVSLQSLIIPASLTSVGDCFLDRSGLKTLYLPANLMDAVEDLNCEKIVIQDIIYLLYLFCGVNNIFIV